MKLVLVVLLATFFSKSLAGEDDVLNLTDDDFAAKVGGPTTTLVMFYAPWYVLILDLYFH